MGLLGIQDRECFAVRMYVEHAVALEIPSALPGFGRRRLRHLYRYRKNIRSKETGSKNNFSGNIDFSVQFLASSVKLGIFTEKSCQDYHNVAADGTKNSTLP